MMTEFTFLGWTITLRESINLRMYLLFQEASLALRKETTEIKTVYIIDCWFILSCSNDRAISYFRLAFQRLCCRWRDLLVQTCHTLANCVRQSCQRPVNYWDFLFWGVAALLWRTVFSVAWQRCAQRRETVRQSQTELKTGAVFSKTTRSY